MPATAMMIGGGVASLAGGYMQMRGAEEAADAQMGILSNAANVNLLARIAQQRQFVQAAQQIAEANNVRAAVNEERQRVAEASRFGNIAGATMGPGLTQALLRAQVEGTARGLQDEQDNLDDARERASGLQRSLDTFNNQVPGALRVAGLQGAENRAMGRALQGAGSAAVNAGVGLNIYNANNPAPRTLAPEGQALGLNPRGQQGAADMDFTSPTPILPPSMVSGSQNPYASVPDSQLFALD